MAKQLPINVGRTEEGRIRIQAWSNPNQSVVIGIDEEQAKSLLHKLLKKTTLKVKKSDINRMWK